MDSSEPISFELSIEDIVRERESIRFANPTVCVAVDLGLEAEAKSKSPERSLTSFLDDDSEGDSELITLAESCCDLVGVRARYVISGFTE